MNQQEAVRYIRQMLDQDHHPDEIVPALVEQLHAPQTLVEKFVAQAEAAYRAEKAGQAEDEVHPWLSELKSQVAAQTISAPAQSRPAASSPQASPPSAPSTNGRQVKLPPWLQELRPDLPRQASILSSWEPSTPSRDPLKDPQLAEFVLKRLGHSRKRSDVVMAVCEQAGVSWEEAERFVAQVGIQKHSQGAAQLSEGMMLAGLVMALAGFLLAAIYGLPILALIGEQAGFGLRLPFNAEFATRQPVLAALLFLGGVMLVGFGAAVAYLYYHAAEEQEGVKTRVIQLEVHDDVISVRDRLNWVKGGRVLLVWPKRARSLDRRLDLVLLLHYCSSLGIKLGLVTKDPQVRYNADELGIPAFDSTRQAQSERWAHRRKPQPWLLRLHPRPNLTATRQLLAHTPPQWALHPLIRAVLFTLAILAPLAIALLLLPEAHITLIPETRLQTLLLDVSASPSADAITLARDLPARRVNAIVEGSDTVTVTGVITVPASFASGKVKFTNMTDAAIEIPAGSIVSTLGNSPIRFATRSSGTITAGPGTTLSLPVDAQTAGAAGNLPAGRIQTIEGPLSFQLAVTNPASMRGGSDVMAPAPTEADRTLLFDQLMNRLQQSATTALQESLPPGDQLISSVVLTGTLEQIYSPSQVQPAAQLALTLRLQFSGISVAADDLAQWAEAVLDANLQDGYTPVAGSLEIRQHSTPQLGADQVARWQIEARRELQAQVSPGEAAARTHWLPMPQALRALQALPLAAPAIITLSPPWWPFVPLRIQVSSGP